MNHYEYKSYQGGHLHALDTDLTLESAHEILIERVEELGSFDRRAFFASCGSNPPQWAVFFTLKAAHELSSSNCMNVGTAIHELLATAAKSRKRAAIRFGKIAFRAASGRNKGSVYVYDRATEKTYIGKIDACGVWRPAAGGEQYGETVARLAKAPIEQAKTEGILTGVCCFCGLPLQNNESINAGYGPVCARYFGLSYGKKPERVKRFA